MTSVARPTFQDEKPTIPTPHTCARMISLSMRLDRLLELALERLMCAPDHDAVIACVGDLMQAKALCAEVLK